MQYVTTTALLLVALAAIVLAILTMTQDGIPSQCSIYEDGSATCPADTFHWQQLDS